jgi:cytochrome c oxidase cbb3-type subunit IV
MTHESATVLAQTIALIIFFALFIGVIAYVLWPGNKRSFEEAANLPLDDEKNDKPEDDRS